MYQNLKEKESTDESRGIEYAERFVYFNKVL